MNDVVLLTGANGFLGLRLLRTWLQGTTARLVACVRPRYGKLPAERLARSGNGRGSQLLEAYRERVFVLPFDLTAEGLGLDASTRDELAASVTHIVHCGGVVRFDLPLEAARRTNAGGTAAVLALARRCVRLRRFDHISTAFVAGRRHGPVLERELDCGQEHHNSYERSKFEGELLVREAAKDMPVAVHRPSIITCDVRTGEAARNSAVTRLMRAYATGALLGVPGRADARLDLVPVDFVADAVLALAGNDATIGGCFHLAAGPGRSTTLGDLRDLAAAGFGRDALALGGAMTAEGAARRILNEVGLYSPYLEGRMDFDVAEASRRLVGTGIEVPVLGAYFVQLAAAVQRRSGP